MEYIDREAAIEAISKLEFVAMDVIAADSINGAFQIVTRYMDKQLRKLPAADVRPVVRGRWQSWEQDKPPCKWYSCDYCGFHALSKSNYCSNCGAMMEEET